MTLLAALLRLRPWSADVGGKKACVILAGKYLLPAGMEGMGQNFVHMLHKHQLKAVENLIRHLGQVFFIVLGHYDLFDAAAASRQQLFAQPADGENTAAQGYLSCHGHIVAHWNAEKGGCY